MMKTRVSLLELNHNEARDFFLKDKSYCSIDLPNYFEFSELLKKLSKELNGKELGSVSDMKSMRNTNNVHYILYTNKNGNLSWRPLQILHPLVYISLVHKITENENWEKIKNRFKDFTKNKLIRCLSIPVQSKNKQSDKAQQVKQWWEEVEQESINLALEYNFVFDTDIADCYSSIYTHSIAWALETKEIAKQQHELTLLGNYIDKRIQDAQYQQTNGIPQGSVLMDFIAEIVLGYVDELLSTKLEDKKINNYRILRYRDDFRIFVTNYNDGEKILQILSDILVPFGLKLNSSKTKSNNDIIIGSIKEDKLSWLKNTIQNLYSLSLQKHLLLIKMHSLQYPNSGSLMTALNGFYERIKITNISTSRKYYNQIISIVTDIAYHNPKCIAVCCAIISLFSSILKDEAYKSVAIKVYNKLKKTPYSGFSQIWLQRVLLDKFKEVEYEEKLCDIVTGKPNIAIWDNGWINSKKILDIFKQEKFFKKDVFDKISPVVDSNEIDLFHYS